MGTYTTPRFKVGTLISYAEILELHDAPCCHQVRYLVRTTCCAKTQTKSHKALRAALQQQWDECPACQRFDRQRKAKKTFRAVIPAYVLRAPVAKVEAPKTIELTPTKPVDLPGWLCLAYSDWPKPPSVRPRIWGQQ